LLALPLDQLPYPETQIGNVKVEPVTRPEPER